MRCSQESCGRPLSADEVEAEKRLATCVSHESHIDGPWAYQCRTCRQRSFDQARYDDMAAYSACGS